MVTVVSVMGRIVSESRELCSLFYFFCDIMSPVEEQMIRKLKVNLKTKLRSSYHWKWPENTIYEPLSINSVSLYRNPIWYREKFSFYRWVSWSPRWLTKLFWCCTAGKWGAWAAPNHWCSRIALHDHSAHNPSRRVCERFMTTVLTTCLAECVTSHSP